jgi:hypothetical protein
MFAASSGSAASTAPNVDRGRFEPGMYADQSHTGMDAMEEEGEDAGPKGRYTVSSGTTYLEGQHHEHMMVRGACCDAWSDLFHPDGVWYDAVIESVR